MATLLIGKWTNEIDLNEARATLSGQSPFDELSLEPDAQGAPTNAPEAGAALPEPQTTVAADNQAKAGVVS